MAVFFLISLSAAEGQNENARRIIHKPVPVYPLECRARGITGKGIVVVTLDPKTGTPIGARMLESTGNKLLDGSALEAFSRWRFKPGIASVKIPVNFTMARKP